MLCVEVSEAAGARPRARAARLLVLYWLHVSLKNFSFFRGLLETVDITYNTTEVMPDIQMH